MLLIALYREAEPRHRRRGGLAMFPEGFSLLRGGVLGSLGWACVAFVLIGASMASIAFAQSRNQRHPEQ